MKKSKVIDVLKTFSSIELKRFKEFVYSPFHNRNKNVIKLFDLIKKYHPEFESEKLEKEKIYKKLFPEKQYNDVVIRILISDLLKLSEEFLSYINFQKKPLEEIKYLLNELKERKLDSLHKTNLSISEKILKEQGRINNFYFLDLCEIETQKIDFLISRDKQTLTASNVLKQGEYLISFFLMGILNIQHELLTHKDVLNVSFDFNLVEETIKRFDIEKVLNYMKKNNYQYFPILSIYYYMYMSYVHSDDKYYFEMKNLIDKNINLFDQDERVNLFIILENISVTKLSNGKEKFYKELMDIYKAMLYHKLYLHTEKEYFQVNLFRNMFYTAMILKEYKWAEKFLGDYLDKLSPEQREDMYHYSRTILYFEKGNFEKALEEIVKVNYKFFVYKYEIKMWMLKIYYELKSFEHALSLIDTFSHFLYKHRNVSKTDKERFGKFLKYLNIFIKIQTRTASIEDYNLKNEISNSSNIISKKWLLEKVDELV